MKESLDRREQIVDALIQEADQLGLDYREDVIYGMSVPFFEISTPWIQKLTHSPAEQQDEMDEINNDWYFMMTDRIVDEIGFEEEEAMDLIDRCMQAMEEYEKEIRRKSHKLGEMLADLFCAWLMDCEFDPEDPSVQKLLQKIFPLLTA